jgi:hypothetical protein
MILRSASRPAGAAAPGFFKSLQSTLTSGTEKGFENPMSKSEAAKILGIRFACTHTLMLNLNIQQLVIPCCSFILVDRNKVQKYNPCFTLLVRNNFKPGACSARAGKEDISKVHRKLMILNHPDRGGSPYIATKVTKFSFCLFCFIDVSD